MADVRFENNSVQVKEAMNDAIIAWLYEVGGELASQTARNSRVDTGQTKGSWTYAVDESDQYAIVGSNYQNAIWEEFGTGQYALQGNGRKTPWAYKDSKGNWHKTTGKRPNRALWNAFESLKTKLQKSLENHLKGLGK